MTPMKVLDTLRKGKLIKENSQTAYLAFTINITTNKPMNIREGV